MCQSAISLISKALHEVDNAELLLKIKGVVAIFIQTTDVSNDHSRFCIDVLISAVVELSYYRSRFLSVDLVREIRRVT